MDDNGNSNANMLNKETFNCPICIDRCKDPTDVASIHGCDHKFCYDCIDRWAERSFACPLCRKTFWNISTRGATKLTRGGIHYANIMISDAHELIYNIMVAFARYEKAFHEIRKKLLFDCKLTCVDIESELGNMIASKF